MNNNMPVINISKNIKDNPLEVWVKIKNYHNVNTINNVLNALNKNRDKKKRKVAQINIFTNKIIKVFDCVADASRELNIDKSKIAKVARNSMSIDSRGFVYNNFSAGGYKWKYI